jgi:hypothetical protein
MPENIGADSAKDELGWTSTKGRSNVLVCALFQFTPCYWTLDQASSTSVSFNAEADPVFQKVFYASVNVFRL